MQFIDLIYINEEIPIPAIECRSNIFYQVRRLTLYYTTGYTFIHTLPLLSVVGDT